MSKVASRGLRIYKRLVSPMTGVSCRFVPSCSEYAAEAVERYGFLLGSAKALGRLLRCHPLARGGYDPVMKCRPQEFFCRDVAGYVSTETSQSRSTTRITHS